MSNPMLVSLFLLLALFWGGSFLAIRIAVEDLPPFFSAFLRIFIAFIGITVYLLQKHKRIVPTKYWPQSATIGIFYMALPWILLFWGEQYVSSALAAILNATVPIFTVLVMPLVNPVDKWSRNKWFGVLLGFAGIVIIFTPGLQGDSVSQLKGMIAVLCMALCYGIAINRTKQISPHIPNAVHLFYQSASASVFVLLASLIFELPHTTLVFSWKSGLALLYLGIFSTALAWIIFFELVKHWGSVQASAVTYLVPLVAIILEALYYKEWIGRHEAFGAVVIFVAVFIINKRKKPRNGVI